MPTSVSSFTAKADGSTFTINVKDIQTVTAVRVKFTSRAVNLSKSVQYDASGTNNPGSTVDTVNASYNAADSLVPAGCTITKRTGEAIGELDGYVAESWETTTRNAPETTITNLTSYSAQVQYYYVVDDSPPAWFGVTAWHNYGTQFQLTVGGSPVQGYPSSNNGMWSMRAHLIMRSYYDQLSKNPILKKGATTVASYTGTLASGANSGIITVSSSQLVPGDNVFTVNTADGSQVDVEVQYDYTLPPDNVRNLAPTVLGTAAMYGGTYPPPYDYPSGTGIRTYFVAYKKDYYNDGTGMDDFYNYCGIALYDIVVPSGMQVSKALFKFTPTSVTNPDSGNRAFVVGDYSRAGAGITQADYILDTYNVLATIPLKNMTVGTAVTVDVTAQAVAITGQGGTRLGFRATVNGGQPPIMTNNIYSMQSNPPTLEVTFAPKATTKVNGVFSDVSEILVRSGGQWLPRIVGYVKKSGVWTDFMRYMYAVNYYICSGLWGGVTGTANYGVRKGDFNGQTGIYSVNPRTQEITPAIVVATDTGIVYGNQSNGNGHMYNFRINANGAVDASWDYGQIGDLKITDQGYLYYGNMSGYLVRYDTVGLAPVWSKSIGSSAYMVRSIAPSTDYVYGSYYNGTYEFKKLSVSAGTLYSTTSGDGFSYYPTLRINKERTYLYVLDRATNSRFMRWAIPGFTKDTAWTFTVTGVLIDDFALDRDGNIFALTVNGKLRKFNTSKAQVWEVSPSIAGCNFEYMTLSPKGYVMVTFRNTNNSKKGIALYSASDGTLLAILPDLAMYVDGISTDGEFVGCFPASWL